MSPLRSLLWTGLGILVCSATLAAAPAAPSRPAKRPATGAASAAEDSDAVLVRIGKEAITRRTLQARLDELPEQYRANYSTPDGRKQLLDRMVEERVWLQDAERNGVPKRPAILHQIEQQRRDLLIRTWVNEVMAGNPAPSDSEAKAYYDDHLADFKMPATVTIRHIQSKTEAESKRALAAARAKGANWDDVVKRMTADTLTKANGGSLGTVTKDGAFSALGTQPALAESAIALGEGKIGGPYKTDRGWHVIKVESVKPEGLRPFEQVRTFVVRQISQQRTQTYYQDQLAKTKAKLGVRADSTVIRSYISSRKSARDMFQEAQSAGAADARIAAYRAVVEQYPDADVSPQAQFMVGFIYSEELKNYDEAEKAFRALLAKYPKSELAPSAQWMVEHMRTEDAPPFLNLEADSSAAKSPPNGTAKRSTGKR